MNLERQPENLPGKKISPEKMTRGSVEKIAANPQDLKRLDMWEKVAARGKLVQEVRDSKILQEQQFEKDPYHLEETKALDEARIQKWKEVAVEKSE